MGQEIKLDTTKPLTHKAAHIDQELKNARTIFKKTNQTVHHLMLELKRGHKTDIQRIEPLIESIVHSLNKNSDALISVCRNKQKDDYLFKHAASTCILAAAFSKSLGHGEETIRDIATGALLSDIGKLFVPSDILNKPGRLTDEEFKAMKQHALYSTQILKKYDSLPETAFRAATEHHERVDGLGYPFGLSNENISDAGQIAAIVDAYDAMTSIRQYQQAKEPTDALKVILSNKDKQFRSDLATRFVQCIGVYPAGSLVALNSGLIAVVLEQSVENLLQPIVRVVFDLKSKKTVQPFIDIDISDQKTNDGLKIISNIKQDRFNFNPMSALG